MDSRSEESDRTLRRLSWPKRLFVILFVFDMVFRSLGSMAPFEEWATEDLKMSLRPQGLPELLEDPNKAWNERKACAASLVRFLNPWPEEQTRERLDSAEAVGQYLLAWPLSRLTFLGRLVGVDQHWPMFSPNVARGDTLARCRLIYADGHSWEHRTIAEPENLLHYSHWFEEKHLQAATKVDSDVDTRIGHCNWLAHTYPQSPGGAALVRIEVYHVRYDYPPPDVDARDFLTRQQGPPVDQVDPVFWIYDVAERKGRFVKS